MFRLRLSDGATQPYGDKAFVTLAPDSEISGAAAAALTSHRTALIAGGIVVDQSTNLAVWSVDLETGALSTTFSGDGLSRFTFGSAGVLGLALAVLPDGSAVIAGVDADGDSGTTAIVKLDSKTAAPIPTFNGGAPLVFDISNGDCAIEVRAVAADAQGRVVLGGSRYCENDDVGSMFAARRRPNGQPDTEFGNASGVAEVNLGADSARLSGMVLQKDRIILGGTIDPAGNDADDDFIVAGLGDGTLFRDGFEVIEP